MLLMARTQMVNAPMNRMMFASCLASWETLNTLTSWPFTLSWMQPITAPTTTQAKISRRAVSRAPSLSPAPRWLPTRMAVAFMMP